MTDELRPCPFCGQPPHFNVYASCVKHTSGFYVKEWNTRPIEDALRKQLDIAVEATKALLYVAEMRRNWDILSSDDFDEAYPDECGWAFGDVDENMIQKMEMAQKALAEIRKDG